MVSCQLFNDERRVWKYFHEARVRTGLLREPTRGPSILAKRNPLL